MRGWRRRDGAGTFTGPFITIMAFNANSIGTSRNNFLKKNSSYTAVRVAPLRGLHGNESCAALASGVRESVGWRTLSP